MPWSTYGSLLFANAFIWTSTAASALSSSVGCSGSSGSGLDEEEDGEQAARGAPRGRLEAAALEPGAGTLRAARAGPTMATGTGQLTEGALPPSAPGPRCTEPSYGRRPFPQQTGEREGEGG